MSETLGPRRSSTPIEIVTAGPLEVAVLAGIHRRCFEEAWDAAALAGLLAMPGAVALVAREPAAGALPVAGALGFVLLRVAADEAEILTLAVVPEARRQGLGRRLLRAALGAACGAGAARLFLEVAEDNEPALALYSSEDFAPIGRRREYYRRVSGGMTALVLARTVMGAAERIGN